MPVPELEELVEAVPGANAQVMEAPEIEEVVEVMPGVNAPVMEAPEIEEVVEVVPGVNVPVMEPPEVVEVVPRANALVMEAPEIEELVEVVLGANAPVMEVPEIEELVPGANAPVIEPPEIEEVVEVVPGANVPVMEAPEIVEVMPGVNAPVTGPPEIKEVIEVVQRSIFMVPELIKRLNNAAYEPHIVSIGPYHHGKSHLKPLEEHKLRAMQQFIRRSNKPEEDYKNALREVEQQLRSSYEQLDENWNNPDRFLELMLVDGCFFIEFGRVLEENSSNDYSPTDPIFSFHSCSIIGLSVIRDTMMLENQLPLQVTRTLLYVESGTQIDMALMLPALTKELKIRFRHDHILVDFSFIW